MAEDESAALLARARALCMAAASVPSREQILSNFGQSDDAAAPPERKPQPQVQPKPKPKAARRRRPAPRTHQQPAASLSMFERHAAANRPRVSTGSNVSRQLLKERMEKERVRNEAQQRKDWVEALHERDNAAARKKHAAEYRQRVKAKLSKQKAKRISEEEAKAAATVASAAAREEERQVKAAQQLHARKNAKARVRAAREQKMLAQQRKRQAAAEEERQKAEALAEHQVNGRRRAKERVARMKSQSSVLQSLKAEEETVAAREAEARRLALQNDGRRKERARRRETAERMARRKEREKADKLAIEREREERLAALNAAKRQHGKPWQDADASSSVYGNGPISARVSGTNRKQKKGKQQQRPSSGASSRSRQSRGSSGRRRGHRHNNNSFVAPPPSSVRSGHSSGSHGNQSYLISPRSIARSEPARDGNRWDDPIVAYDVSNDEPSFSSSNSRNRRCRKGGGNGPPLPPIDPRRAAARGEEERREAARRSNADAELRKWTSLGGGISTLASPVGTATAAAIDPSAGGPPPQQHEYGSGRSSQCLRINAAPVPHSTEQSPTFSVASGAWGSPVALDNLKQTFAFAPQQQQQREYAPLQHSPPQQQQQQQRPRRQKKKKKKQQKEVWRQAPIPLGSPTEFQARAASNAGETRSPVRGAGRKLGVATNRGSGGGGGYAAAHSRKRVVSKTKSNAVLSPINFNSGSHLARHGGSSSVAGSASNAIRAARRGRYDAEEF